MPGPMREALAWAIESSGAVRWLDEDFRRCVGVTPEGCGIGSRTAADILGKRGRKKSGGDVDPSPRSPSPALGESSTWPGLE